MAKRPRDEPGEVLVNYTGVTIQDGTLIVHVCPDCTVTERCPPHAAEADARNAVLDRIIKATEAEDN